LKTSKKTFLAGDTNNSGGQNLVEIRPSAKIFDDLFGNHLK
jgi:hypothetical protein